MSASPYLDRRDAGRRLAALLTPWTGAPPLVLALPRGGVPVAFEIARALHAPLDILLVRKIGAPHNPELGIGAVVEGEPPQRVLNDELVAALDVPDAHVEAEVARQLARIEAQRRQLRGGRPPPAVAGREVILVDDGIATGGTVRAALQALTQAGAARVLLAVPVAPPQTLAQLPLPAQDVVCPLQPYDLQAVGRFYMDFDQTDDAEVTRLLAEAAAAP
ncbi:phosphoribosyltransferase [Azohydromonas caseinilytica]|uniref:Phosphoribosyltransferase n=1 Tax=Azohydromonas caseinilytica TaxID=2728836 RepID=A0A848F389_9BURK|nr:phosphoribosyltransferase [Azohydromonas caseinilytica]NML13518.1 phosphoribosyltransferase [Azohydromonas caseinilytica]